jgi:hypothetical protein
LLEELRVVVFLGDIALQQHVGVGIHESGEHGGFRKIDQFDAGGRRSAWRDADNFVAFDQDQCVGDRCVAFAVNQVAGAYRELLRGRRRLFLSATD